MSMLLLASSFASACSKQDDDCDQEPVHPAVEPIPAGLDEAFVEIAKLLPEFAGLYVDEAGALTVRMVGGVANEEQYARIHEALAAVLGPDYYKQAPACGGPLAPNYGINVIDADFSVVQLSTWRAIADEALATPGVLLTDLDERQNRVIIGVKNARAHERVEEMLAAKQIPTKAVVIETVKPIRYYESLRDKIRPVPGGVQVELDTGVLANTICTMGFNVIVDGRRGLLTNSHCTDRPGVSEGTDVHQPNDPFNPFADQKKIGDEYFDPAFSTASPCPAGRSCKRSDAAFIEYDATSFLGSTIARTTELWGGSLNIDPSNRSFRVVGEELFPLAGTELHKVGRTTGWTNGTVDRTCFNTAVAGAGNVTMLCQYSVARPPGTRAIADRGDSGSPVFRRGPANEAELFGILWGGPSDNSAFVFSSMLFLHLDLFPMTVELNRPGPAPTPRPLGCEVDEKCCEREADGDCSLCIPRTASCL